MDCIVNTDYGPIKGYVENGIYKFHGIPYAKPPVGPLRFKEPQLPEPWQDVYDATYRRPVAPQGPSDLDLPMGPLTLPTDEDCLTLAVSTPTLDGSLPVAVWFHGGANCYCGGDLAWYDGASLSRIGGIVEVNINYRLGPLGFLCAKGVNDKTLSIEDGMLALHWVQNNIKRFGGDPSKVTLFGQSAGANAITHILSRTDSEGLFQQVILESASLGRGNHTLEDAYEIGKAVIENLGIDPDSLSVREQLQGKSVQDILDAGDNVPKKLRAKHQGMIFKPVNDKWHTPEQTVRAAAKEAIKRGIRIVLGTTKDEMHAFILQRDPDALELASKLQELRYDMPDGEFADAAAAGGCPVWKYRFDWQAQESLFDSCHCLELPFLFGNINSWDAPMLKGASDQEMLALQQTMQSLWCTFFRFETPDAAIWPIYTSTGKVKHIDNVFNPILDV